MWLVNAALRRPYTVWVGMLLVFLLGLFSYQQTPTDILPNLKVPVVVVFASYRGMPAPDMEQSVVSVLERSLTRCDHLHHLESRSLLGIGIIQVYFRPEVDPDVASSQVLALVMSEMQNMPPGMLPPTVLKYDASAIPVGNLVLVSDQRDDKYLLDLADHNLRDELAGIGGLASAPVFGGLFRQVQIFVHPRRLEALKLSPMDVVEKVNRQSLVLPNGEIRIGDQNYYVNSNSMMQTPRDFEQIPLWHDGRKVVLLGDVAEVQDGTRWRTNTVRVNGQKAVYLPLLRQAGASAVTVVDNVEAFLPQLKKRGTVPEDVNIGVAFDQSEYVREALANLRSEGIAGAVLASLVVLLFLGSLRSTWIVAISIPLSVFAAFLGLYFTGHTLNIMTLGGLALVLGRVIDDSIVDVENTVRHLGMGKTPLEAARDSAQEIALPVLMATITTVVVFLPLVFMKGVARDLFTPLAVSATLAMFASYFVSRTVSPLYCARFLRPHGEPERFPWGLFGVALVVALTGLAVTLLRPQVKLFVSVRDLPFGGRILRNLADWLVLAGLCGAALVALIPIIALLWWLAPRFDRVYEVFADAYARTLRVCLRWRWAVLALLLVLIVPAVWAYGRIGQELFPEVDSGEFTVHMRASGGPRVEETERQVAEIEQMIREVVPAEDLRLILSNIGVNSRWSAIYTSNNGPHAAFVRVQLRSGFRDREAAAGGGGLWGRLTRILHSGFEGRRTPTLTYVERLRTRLEERFPTNDFFFETGGMIRRILNAGAPAPIEVQIIGRDTAARRAVARELDARITAARDTTLTQVGETYLPQGMDLPQLYIEVDRTKAELLGFTQSDVIRNVITALMSSAQIAPNFWIEPSTGNPYIIGVQYPEYLVQDVHTLEDIPISNTRAGGRVAEKGAGPTVRLLKDVATIRRTQGPVEVYHNEVSRVSQLFISVRGNDLARAAAEVQRLADGMELPKGVRIQVRGEVASMRESFTEMGFNLMLAVVLVYLVMAAQFSSWLDPLVMIVAAPLGLIGVIAMLWATDTSFNIQSAMGVLMMIGISVSNSVLLIEFANRQRAAGMSSFEAVVSAARVRLRPILMTTLATMVGLLPMAIHLRPGDEMNLPLARAVIGGLATSTVLTLFIVPILYVLLKRRSAPTPVIES